MKKFSVLIIIVLILSLGSCAVKKAPPAIDTYTDALPEKFDATEIEFSASYVKISGSEAFADNVRWMRTIGDLPSRTKNPDLCRADAEWSELESITKTYTSEFFKTNYVFAFTVSVTSGDDSVAVTRVTQDKNECISFYVDTLAADGGTADFATYLVFVATKQLEISNMQVFVNPTVKTPAQTIKNEIAGIELTLPEGWGYSEMTDDFNKIGFDIGPEKYGSRGLEIYYNENRIEALCGTGLTTGIIKLGKFDVYAYSYDGAYPFSFARVGDKGHELSNTGAGHWWAEYESDLDDIFDSLILSDVKDDVGLEFNAQYVRANVEYTPNLPYTEVIHSREELSDYKMRFAVDADKDNSQYADGTISFNMAAQKYTDEFFENNQLILCMIEETSGSIRHKVERVNVTNDIDMSIIINRDIPEICTDDMATWHISVETEKTCTPNDRIEIMIDSKNKGGVI